MAQSKIHVGLEIGTSKVCMVVGDAKADGSLTIIGVGEVRSEGVVKGEITETGKVIQCIYDAWTLAQDHADADIMTVYLAVAGSHIIGENNSGTFRLPEDEHVISSEHMHEVTEIAKDMPLSGDQFVLHRIPGLFSVDGQSSLSNPEGLSGRTLDINCHIIHGTRSKITNSLRCVYDVPLEVEDVVFSPIAAAQFCLNRQSRQNGALLIDMGAGTTDYVLYVDDQLVASGSIPLGGDHITSDISIVTKIPWAQAEILKITEGDAFSNPKQTSGVARVAGDGNMREVAIDRAELNKLIQIRAAEILTIIRSRLPKEAFQTRSVSEVYLCGGSSLLRGLGELASKIFGVTINQPENIHPENTNTPVYLEDPRFATAIGLIRYAQILDAETPKKKGFLGTIKGLLSRG